MIFSAIERLDSSPKANGETEFAFLNRSARSEIGIVRQMVEDWAQEYPAADVAEPIARIQSGNDANFRSACFELILYATLTRLGFTLQPHPELLNGSQSRPDFLVRCSDGSEFYLEAVLASEANDSNPAAEARIGRALDTLDSAPHANFLVSIDSEGLPTTQPGGARLRRDVIRWLDSLNPDEVQARFEGQEAPTLEWNHEDWILRIQAIPLSAERRGKSQRLIGAQGGMGGFVDAWTPIRNAVKYKGSKYGVLDKPFAIAINVDSFHLDRIDEMQALFGQEEFVFNANNLGAEPQMRRAPNGAWYGKRGPQYTRVSGVWLFNDLTPYTIAKRRQTLYLNPWAAQPLPESLLRLPHAFGQNGKMEWIEGLLLREILEVSETWPE